MSQTPANIPGATAAAPITDPLAQLRDIHLPEPVGWWPLAPGWWLLLVLGIVGAMVAILWWRAWRRRNAWRRQAQSALNAIDVPTPGPQELQQLNRILRRSLISAGDQSCAQLSGRDWVAYLRERGLPVTHDDILAVAPYRETLDEEQARIGGELIHAAQHWVKRLRLTPIDNGRRAA